MSDYSNRVNKYCEGCGSLMENVLQIECFVLPAILGGEPNAIKRIVKNTKSIRNEKLRDPVRTS